VANLRFEWDEAKNLINQRKHGIRFEQAIEVFNDPFHVQILDRIENGEEQWQTFGLIHNVLLVMVAHTVLETWEQGGLTETFEIISARYADKKDRRIYENENG
jgi:uncharacterized DUF497 family protein